MTAASSGGLMDWSSSARTDCATRRPPVTRMLTPTVAATTGSSRCQPVTATRSTPTSTPADVQTSVIRCLPSAVSVAERHWRPTRINSQPTAPLTRVARADIRQAKADTVRAAPGG